MTTKHRRRSISFNCAAETLLYSARLEKMTVLVSKVLPPNLKRVPTPVDSTHVEIEGAATMNHFIAISMLRFIVTN